MNPTITLHGGPWNGRTITDHGTVLVRMGIATEWMTTPEGWVLPAPGARGGFARYEPTPDRRHAHWLDNEWDGVIVEVTPTDGER